MVGYLPFFGIYKANWPRKLDVLGDNAIFHSFARFVWNCCSGRPSPELSPAASNQRPTSQRLSSDSFTILQSQEEGKDARHL
jgi:hypothetical protein